jgi:hypothetical protein
MRVEFTIAGQLPLANEWSGMKGWGKKRIKDNWWFKIKYACQEAGIRYIGNTSYFKEKVWIDVLLTSKHEWDDPNIRNMVDKIIVDQLYDHPRRKASVCLIPGDNPRYLEWGKIEQKRGNPAVQITLTPVKED